MCVCVCVCVCCVCVCVCVQFDVCTSLPSVNNTVEK